MAKDIKSDVVVEAPEAEVQEAPSKGLSTRDALEVAILSMKEGGDDDAKSGEVHATEGGGEVQPSAKEGAPAGGDVPAPVEDKVKPKESGLVAPSEYSDEEKADFYQSSRKEQEAALRLHRSRMRTLEEIKTAKAEFSDLTALRDSMAPYLKAIGVKEPTEVALKKALKMWREFEDGDPRVAAAAYLKAKNIEVPEALLSQGGAPKEIEEKISPLQERLSSLESKIAADEAARVGEVLSTAWSNFEQTKNAGGGNKYPDISNSEEGLKLSANIGSLVNGNTPLSQQFIANAKARIPDLTYPVLLEQAYRFCGGRVDDSEAPKTQTTQSDTKHISVSRRAASSKPGNAAVPNSSSSIKKMSRREALAAAIATVREREGG